MPVSTMTREKSPREKLPPCSRCGGWVYRERSIGETRRVCLNCGREEVEENPGGALSYFGLPKQRERRG